MKIKPGSPRRVTIIDGTPQNPYEFWYDLDAETFKASLGSTTYEIAAAEGGSGPTLYTPTLTNAQNTAAETNIIAATIPGGTWADGEIVTVELAIKAQQYIDGSTQTGFTLKGKGGGGSAVLMNISTWDGAQTPSRFTLAWNFIREGTTIVIMRPAGTLYTDTNEAFVPVLWRAAQNTVWSPGDNNTGIDMAKQHADSFQTGGIITGADFAADQTLAISAQWGDAAAGVFFNPIGGKVWK
jgi:hypothetical protein